MTDVVIVEAGRSPIGRRSGTLAAVHPAALRVHEPVRGRGENRREVRLTRKDTDALGLESQLRAARARAEGRFDSQLIPLEVPAFDADGKRTGETVRFASDEIPRDTSLEALAGLRPVAREDGVHTAGSSSQIADGGAAVLLMSAERATRAGLTPLVRVVGTALVGCDPVLMLEGPIPATLEAAGGRRPRAESDRRGRDQ